MLGYAIMNRYVLKDPKNECLYLRLLVNFLHLFQQETKASPQTKTHGKRTTLNPELQEGTVNPKASPESRNLDFGDKL